MPTAREFFDNQPYLSLHYDAGVNLDGAEYFATIKFCYDFEAGSKHLQIYLPGTEWDDAILALLINNQQEFWKQEQGIEITSGIAGGSESISGKTLKFTGRVVAWTPAIIDAERWAHISKQLASMDWTLVVRDGAYVERRSSFSAPPAFISHDTRDKDGFVRPLAEYLQRQLCPIWYDEYSLKPGDSLRDSIEKGLKTCGKCVVVLSPNFFKNGGWTKREFDSIYTREIIEQKRVMIPVWLNVVKREVYEYSPILADTVGIPASLGVEEVAKRIINALDFKPPHA